MKQGKLTAFVLLILFALNARSQENGIALSVDSAPIYYRTFGSGHPVLIINGGPGMNSDGFEGLAVTLSKNYRTILYDQRGTGKSVLHVADSTTVTMKLMLDDMESLRKQLKIEKWSILGHSFGGMLASYYATNYPQHIDKLVLSSSGGINLGLLNYVQASINSKLKKTDLDSVNYWNAKISGGDTSHYARLERGKHLAPAYVINKKFIPVIAERLTQGNSTVNQLIWADLQRINFDCSNKLQSFNNPVLIIQGKEDIIKPETAEQAHKAFKNSKVVFVEHSSHYSWLDNARVYYGEIHSFLNPGN